MTMIPTIVCATSASCLHTGILVAQCLYTSVMTMIPSFSAIAMTPTSVRTTYEFNNNDAIFEAMYNKDHVTGPYDDGKGRQHSSVVEHR